ncbi:MAG: hypothetical protein IMF26_03820 [Candidatus Fermentithermobacillus carboniphilus]|uniref:Uncharacterized protein n=1 Tax=Candidatus Fermentithermobacillus carboniphilus TaxID=3085328 RepID=A0AAT9LET6_9FIRM|nr:MAG: hypothetical protein IMF26_03820 [Candidatus Fermentithermobacillus carboniphilus]
MKREVPVAISALVGLVLLIDYFFKIPSIRTMATEIQDWGLIIAAFALALAAVNLLRIHVSRIGKWNRNSIHSFILVAAMLITVFSGIVLGRQSKPFDFIFQAIFNPLASAFYAMTAFHLASASYRAFRAKNAQAAALLIAGVLLMLGRAPIGEAMWSRFPKIADWIMGVVNLAGSRGILISTAVGMVGVSLRVLTGIDRSHLGGGAE